MSGPILWFIIGVGCMVLELVSPMFIIFFLGLGAWAASLSMYFDASLAMSFGVFSVVSVASLIILRRVLIKTLQGSSHAAKDNPTQMGMHVGKQATVSQVITHGVIGEVTLGGSYWRAILDTEVQPLTSLEIGTTVIVTDHDPEDAILLCVRPL